MTGRRLTAEQATKVTAPLAWYPLVLETDVFYSASSSATGAARLPPSGKTGTAETPSPDPMTSKVGPPVAVTRAAGRLVWVLAGDTPVGGGINFRPTLQACCDETGTPTNLSRFATFRVQSPPRAHAAGVDANGRVWIAWVDGQIGRSEVRMLELDPRTLAPRTGKALVAPIERVVYPVIPTQTLPHVCTTTCRVVVSSYHGLPPAAGECGSPPGRRASEPPRPWRFRGAPLAAVARNSSPPNRAGTSWRSRTRRRHP